jgi:hypothetical protein
VAWALLGELSEPPVGRLARAERVAGLDGGPVPGELGRGLAGRALRVRVGRLHRSEDAVGAVQGSGLDDGVEVTAREHRCPAAAGAGQRAEQVAGLVDVDGPARGGEPASDQAAGRDTLRALGQPTTRPQATTPYGK